MERRPANDNSAQSAITGKLFDWSEIGTEGDFLFLAGTTGFRVSELRTLRFTLLQKKTARDDAKEITASPAAR
jgi:hypothetical protein